MDIMVAITVIGFLVCCIIVIKIFSKDSKHDLEIQGGKFRLSKHDRK